jgi:hypothetical protein
MVPCVAGSLAAREPIPGLPAKVPPDALEGRWDRPKDHFQGDDSNMAKGKKAAKGGALNLVVGSKVKEMVRGAGVRAAGDLVEACSAAVGGMLKNAVARCKANGRGTVRPHDL